MQLYISKEVGCRTIVRNPPLTRNCDWEDFADYGHCSTLVKQVIGWEDRQRNSLTTCIANSQTGP